MYGWGGVNIKVDIVSSEILAWDRAVLSASRTVTEAKLFHTSSLAQILDFSHLVYYY